MRFRSLPQAQAQSNWSSDAPLANSILAPISIAALTVREALSLLGTQACAQSDLCPACHCELNTAIQDAENLLKAVLAGEVSTEV